MLLFIYLCILVLNMVAVYLIYRFLGTQLEKKEKWIFIIAGVAIMYLIVTAVYGISTKDIDIGKAASTARNLITFAFVPVNGIVILPFLARSYRYLKEGRLQVGKFKNRCILIGIILIIVLIIEFFYFKNIQSGILNAMSSHK